MIESKGQVSNFELLVKQTELSNHRVVWER